MNVLETGAAAAEARLAAVMLHGRSRAAVEMAELGAAFGLHDLRFNSPQAEGNSWYPGRFLEPLAHNQPALDQAVAAIGAVLDQLNTEGFGAERIVLCGFSQGACLVAELLLRRPAPYAAAIIFTGGVIGPPGTVWQPREPLDGMPVLLTGSETDEWIPVWRSRQTAEVLAAAGAKVAMTIYPDRPHEVCSDEIAKARALILALGPPQLSLLRIMS